MSIMKKMENKIKKMSLEEGFSTTSPKIPSSHQEVQTIEPERPILNHTVRNPVQEIDTQQTHFVSRAPFSRRITVNLTEQHYNKLLLIYSKRHILDCPTKGDLLCEAIDLLFEKAKNEGTIDR